MRYINQNRRKLIKYFLIAVAILLLIQVLNYVMKPKGNGTDRDISINSITAYGSPDTAVVESTKVSENEKEEEMVLIKQFVDLCNQGKTEEAYNILSDDCKEIFYPSIDKFINQYYNTFFQTKRTPTIQSWITEEYYSTYKVNYTDDNIIETGKISDQKIETYITIEKRENKINLNKFVYRNKINKGQEQDGIAIQINNVEKYIENEIYSITIENKNDRSISLDSRTQNKTIYLTDSEENRYSAYINEVGLSDLIIRPTEKKVIKIKFNKMYNPERKIDKISFTDIIKDYEQYKSLSEKDDYTDRINLNIGF